MEWVGGLYTGQLKNIGVKCSMIIKEKLMNKEFHLTELTLKETAKARIYDNCLPPDIFKKMQETLCGGEFPWFLNKIIVPEDFWIESPVDGNDNNEVHQFCHIGSHAFVAGGSLVRKDVPPYVKAAREPLSFVGINSVGLRRRGFSSSKIVDIQNIYKILYQKIYNNTQALEIIAAELSPTPERDEIIQFVENSKRGIMKGYFQRS